VWYTALPKCAFCGIEGEEQPMSTHTGRLPEAPAPAAQAEPEKPEAAVAVAEATPVPPTHADAEPTPLPETKAPATLEPPPSAVEKPVERPSVENRPDPVMLPPAPLVPSSTVPLVFGLLGFAACVVLPIAMLPESSRVVGILSDLGAAILLPFAPLAWFAGHRYEERCFKLGFNPARSGRSGRLLGMVVTILITLEGSVVAFIAALQRISAR
jgi:hypothetical protein